VTAGARSHPEPEAPVGPLEHRRRRGRALAAGLAIGGLAVALLPAAAGAALRLQVDGLEPRFRPAVRDYVVGCSEPVALRVRTPGRTEARIGAGGWIGGGGRRTVRLVEGQAIRIVARTAERRRAFRIRCLPQSFPPYEFRRTGKPASHFYVLTPATSADSRYVAMFDRHGIPIWWYEDEIEPFDAKVLEDGTIVWSQFSGFQFSLDPASSYEFHGLDGRLLNELRTVGAVTDQHELLPTPDGNYLLVAYKERAGSVDLSAHVDDPDGHVYEAIIQELTPDGELVWEWSSEGRIDPAETGRWWRTLQAFEPYDYVHINAVELLPGGDLLISLRHTDALYRIDRASGEIEWKLGGEPTADSLRIEGDPLGGYPFGGQHDVRYLGGGRISVYDNGTNLGRAPRAALYRVEGGTATLLESVSDPAVPASVCCGSARYLDGSWLVSWGGTELVSEVEPSGAKAFELEFGQAFSYRAAPTDDVTRRELRAGMDAQVPLKR
jgi:hypothetical protein